MRIGTAVRFTPEHAKYLKDLGKHEDFGIVQEMNFFTAVVSWETHSQRHFIDLLEEV
jgi:hypothetical protein